MEEEKEDHRQQGHAGRMENHRPPSRFSFPRISGTLGSNVMEQEWERHSQQLAPPDTAERSSEHDLTMDDLKTWLVKYSSANAILAQRVEALECENRRLRLQNEELARQLQSMTVTMAHQKEQQEASLLTAPDYVDSRERLGSSSTAMRSDSTSYSGPFVTCRSSLAAVTTGAREASTGNAHDHGVSLRITSRGTSLDQETANRLISALEDAPLHISYCDSERRYVWFNHTLKGLTHDQIVGKRDEEIISSRSEGLQQFIELKKKAVETGEIQAGEVTLDWPENGRVTWMVTTKPHLNEHGNVVGISTASIDITEQVEVKECLLKLRAEMSVHKATEDELRRAVQVTEDAIQAKNVFLAIMSHEIRTPLNGLLGLAETLDSLELSHEQRELVSAILSSGIIVADILGDILDLASMEFEALELEERPFDPSEIVQDIVTMAVAATRGKDVVIRSEISNHLSSKVVGDVVRIRQIMKYLVLNAIKFTVRGSVCIRVRVDQGRADPKHKEQPEAVSSSSASISAILYCEVADTGVGIPEEAFATLFDKFKQLSEGRTRSHGGTGLGLALCKRLVEFMGGELTVWSEVGKGSTFAFTVKCKELGEPMGGTLREEGEAAGEGEEEVARCDWLEEPAGPLGVVEGEAEYQEEGAGGGSTWPRILLAEDNQVNVMVAISMLKRLGFTAKVVGNGLEAIEAVRKDKYDLVLLDICMPLMDGLQVAHAIRRFEQTGHWPPLSTTLDIAAAGPLQSSSSLSSQPSPHSSVHVGLPASSASSARRLPIVAVTANALRSDVDRCFAHGVDAFIAKPVMFQKLQEIVHKYLPAPSCSSSSSSIVRPQ